MRFLLATFCGSLCYMAAMVKEGYDDIVASFVLPFMGLIVSGIACGVLLLGKLSLKYLPWLNDAWNRRWYAAPIIGISGVVAMGVAWHPALRVQVMNTELGLVDSFHPVLGIGGWLAMMFGILFYPRRPGKPKPRVRPGQLEW